MGYGRSLVQRLFEAVVVLLIVAWLLRWAVQIISSILWPLIGIGAVVLVGVATWHLSQSQRDMW